MNGWDSSSASRAREMKRCLLRLPYAGDSRAKGLLGLEASENSESYRRCHVGNHPFRESSFRGEKVIADYVGAVKTEMVNLPMSSIKRAFSG